MFKTEEKLKKLFEFARFEKDPRIEKLADETLRRYPVELSDDALGFVNAAGEFTVTPETKDDGDPAGQ